MQLRRMLSLFLLSAVTLCAPSLLFAQSNATPKVEIFGGYSWYHPGGTDGAGGTTGGGTTTPDATSGSADIPDASGWGAQFTYNLNHWAGLAIDATGHYVDQGSVYTVAAGPQFRIRRYDHFTPFGEVLLGFAHWAPNGAPDDNDFALMIGGGLDYKVTPRISIRLAQVDYVMTYYNALTPAGQNNMLNGVRVQGGVVFNFGLPKEEAAVSASCSASPTEVEAGAPVQVNVSTSGFLPKRVLSYSFTSSGGKVSGKGPGATVDTTGLDAGSYSVSAKVSDNGQGKHQRMADCQTGFSVIAKHPPVISVSSNPDSLYAGGSSAITATCSSPDNRPVTTTCSANAGSLSGSGANWTLETSGLDQSTVGVNCTCTDDRGLSASAGTSVRVNVKAPEVKAAPPAPEPTKWGNIEFTRDKKRPTRVDNEAKATLDRYADALAAAPDAKGVVVGFALSSEPNGYAAQRAVNSKEYLTKEKGIDPARIEARTGDGNDQRVDLWIVPAGATFPSEGTAAVDEGAVKAVPRVPLGAKAAHKRHHKKAKAD
jgi:outer membrane protein OmpA-like peptidoglycan-associated protein